MPFCLAIYELTVYEICVCYVCPLVLYSAFRFSSWTDNIRVFIQDDYHLDQTEKDEAKRLSIDVVENDPLIEIRDVHRPSISSLLLTF